MADRPTRGLTHRVGSGKVFIIIAFAAELYGKLDREFGQRVSMLRISTNEVFQISGFGTGIARASAFSTSLKCLLLSVIMVSLLLEVFYKRCRLFEPLPYGAAADPAERCRCDFIRIFGISSYTP